MDEIDTVPSVDFSCLGDYLEFEDIIQSVSIDTIEEYRTRIIELFQRSNKDDINVFLYTIIGYCNQLITRAVHILKLFKCLECLPFFVQMVEKLIHILENCWRRSRNGYRVTYVLVLKYIYDNGIINKGILLKSIKKIFNNNVYFTQKEKIYVDDEYSIEDAVSGILFLYSVFHSEIKENNHKLFEKAKTFFQKIQPLPQSDMEVITILQNFDLHLKRRFIDVKNALLNRGFPMSISSIIYRDNLEELKIFESFYPRAINGTIPSSNFETLYDVTDQITPLCYAAIYGSINCFKYLILKTADINNTDLYYNALIGGNTEILQIVRQVCQPITSEFSNYIDCRNFKVFQWFFEYCVIPPENITEEYQSIISNSGYRNQLQVYKYIVELGGIVNGSPGDSIINEALSGSSYLVCKALFRLKEIQFFNEGNEFYFFQNSIRSDNTDLIRFIIHNDLFKSVLEKVIHKVLIFAVKQDNTEILDILLELPFVEINKQDHGQTPISTAVSYGASESIKWLISNPKIDLSCNQNPQLMESIIGQSNTSQFKLIASHPTFELPKNYSPPNNLNHDMLKVITDFKKNKKKLKKSNKY